jgi:hypothetical protein
MRRGGPAARTSGTPDLRWDDAGDCFDPAGMGTLPDVRVPGASAAGRQALLDLVATGGWWHEYTEGGTVLPLPTVARVPVRPLDAEVPRCRVCPSAPSPR